jgi:prepilin-type N-terminal cleavage/methylation domain-containing protein
MMRRKAFTVVELIIVIIIMSVLGVITALQFVNARQKANDVSRKGDLNAVSKALNLYFADYGKMPIADSKGQIIVGKNALDWGKEFSDASGYVYLKQLPKENKKNYPQYCYKVSNDGKSYALFAMLENKGDEQCIDGATYDCGGMVNAYCFAYYSVGVNLDKDGNIL